MKKAVISQDVFRQRREKFFEKLGNRAAIIPASNLVTHHADCEYPFRQNSDFWYLTGLDEHDAVALFLPQRHSNERFILFVLPKDPALEVWHGSRLGHHGAVEEIGADLAHPLNELEDKLPKYLAGAKGIVFRVGKNANLDSLVLKAWTNQLDQLPRVGSGASSLEPPCPIIHDLRLYKDSYEIDQIREAARISSLAHELAREQTHPGMNEREVQAILEKCFLDEGARGPAYGSIVAGGDNACILHYTKNNSPLLDGDLLLIDAGCSLDNYYNADITRTFPVNGKLNPEQIEIYKIVLEAQNAAINIAQIGENTENIHFAAVKVIVDGLKDLGLLVGDTNEIINNGLYRHLYMHRTGHWLGLDVHDVGAYRMGDHPLKLNEGMVLTVEPGIYISDRLSVPEGQPSIKEKWKGIGIRIEDNILITSKGPDVLTLDAKKTISDIQC
tara:strand:+ start:2915 stop:4246 length:1332 start_codon:yes stop_codon:yes gene_type:complete